MVVRATISLFVAAATAVAASSSDLNLYPIIGVFTQPSTDTHAECGGNCVYLAASYVKNMEAAGARVVPIPFYASHAELDYLFDSVNGIFFPGGGTPIGDSGKYIFNKVVAANDRGDYFPLWGTCLGFQWLICAASGNDNIIDGGFDSYNWSIPLDFTEEAFKSRLFAKATPEMMKVLATEDVTLNNHHAGIATDHFYKTKALTSFFKVLSTNDDKNGWNFISTVESYNYPIYGIQWHPEKNAFEWGKQNGEPYEALPHSPEAIEITQYMANFFVNEARKNFHKFPSSDEEDAHLIYSYTPTRTGPSFVQSYFFHF